VGLYDESLDQRGVDRLATHPYDSQDRTQQKGRAKPAHPAAMGEGGGTDQGQEGDDQLGGESRVYVGVAERTRETVTIHDEPVAVEPGIDAQEGEKDRPQEPEVAAREWGEARPGVDHPYR